METEEFEIIATDGSTLFAKSWECPKPKGIVCIVHGLGEHCARYEHVAKHLCEHDLSAYAIDLRGHGKSNGKRGHSPSHDILLDDVEELLKFARAEHNDLPLFLYGHSLGGNIVSNYILKRNTNELKGAIISSAWFKTKVKVSSIELKIAKVVNRFYPSLTQSNKLDPRLLTRDDQVNKAYVDDPMVHQKISIRLGLEALDAGFWAHQNADLLKLNTLVWHGTDDQITCFDSSMEFAERAGEIASFKSWENSRHEPHNDLDKEEVLKFTSDWINETLIK